MAPRYQHFVTVDKGMVENSLTECLLTTTRTIIACWLANARPKKDAISTGHCPYAKLIHEFEKQLGSLTLVAHARVPNPASFIHDVSAAFIDQH